MEVWKPVFGYEGLYEVSSDGGVRSLDRVEDFKGGKRKRSGKTLKLHRSHRGYLRVQLCIGGKVSFKSVHRLVCLAFVENPGGKPEVNHLDENKENNRYTNLEWATRVENGEYSHAKMWRFVDPNGCVRDIFNLKKFCRENDLIDTNMHQLFYGKVNTIHGWTRYSPTEN